MNKINLGSCEVDLNDLTISDDFNKINQDLSTHPGKFLQVALASSHFRLERERVENEYERVVATVDRDIREASAKKPPEDQIKNIIRLDGRVIEAEKAVMDARDSELRASMVLEAFRQRKDCLVSIAGNLRSQFENTGV